MASKKYINNRRPCIHPGCNYPVFAKDYCNRHQYLRSDHKPYKPRYYSKKRAKENRVYSKLSHPFLSDRSVCEIRSPDCTGLAEGIHHIKGRGKLLNDKTKWMSSCNACNGYVERHHQWAVDNGFKESRLKNKE